MRQSPDRNCPISAPPCLGAAVIVTGHCVGTHLCQWHLTAVHFDTLLTSCPAVSAHLQAMLVDVDRQQRARHMFDATSTGRQLATCLERSALDAPNRLSAAVLQERPPAMAGLTASQA